MTWKYNPLTDELDFYKYPLSEIVDLTLVLKDYEYIHEPINYRITGTGRLLLIGNSQLRITDTWTK